jgi:TctA family transporter
MLIPVGFVGIKLFRQILKMPKNLVNVVENNFRIGMLKSGGDYTWFLNDPICITLVVLIFLTFFSSPLYRLIRRLWCGGSFKTRE